MNHSNVFGTHEAEISSPIDEEGSRNLLPIYEVIDTENYEHLTDRAVIRRVPVGFDTSRVTWQIMDFDNFRLDHRRGKGSVANGQAMELATEWCRTCLSSLLSDLAGGHGPVSEQELHDTMCNYCYLSDQLRGVAMSVSQCDCLDLSTSSEAVTYTKEGDFASQIPAIVYATSSADVVKRNAL